MASNGNLGAGDLAPAAGGVPGTDPGCGHLANDTARRWNAMAAKIANETGTRIGCNGPDSMYRSYNRQQYWKTYWCARGACGNAATPGTSNHGWGHAIDNSFRGVIDQYGGPYGFRWACSDAPWESWHLKDCGPAGAYSGPDPGPDYSFDPAEPTYPILRKGDKGEAVKRMQRRLAAWNVGLTQPTPDGSFGEATADAVREFQVVHGLDEDGIVGKGTWAKLRNPVILTDQELSHVNRLRLEERRDHPDADKVHNLRDWLGHRRDWMRKQPPKWWSNRRHARFRIIKREAGDA